MKLQESLLNTPVDLELSEWEEIGDSHHSTSINTPMSEDAFTKSDEEKKELIEFHFSEIMKALGLDLTDDSLRGTPKRVAKMYVDEIFNGLDPKNKPQIALFEKNISFYSNCEHHFVPIIGRAHLAYVSSGKVIGLSKLNRIVNYFAKRPQVQERLTNQIASELKDILQTEDVAVLIDAKHLCVSSRGVKDDTSSTFTSYYGGVFKEDSKKRELFAAIKEF